MTPVQPDPLDLVTAELRKVRKLAETHVALLERSVELQEESTAALGAIEESIREIDL